MQAAETTAHAESLSLEARRAAGPSAGTASARSEGGGRGAAPAFSFDFFRLCPLSAKFIQVPHGRLQAKAGHGMFGVPVSIVAQFSVPLPIFCDCKCGEYRQFVRGSIRVGEREAATTCSGPMDPKNFVEDCAAGAPVPGGKVIMGHRDTPLPGISVYADPDQETGCRFMGDDFPGVVDVQKAEFVEMHLDFQSKLVDACHGDAVLAQATWGVDGEGIVQP